MKSEQFLVLDIETVIDPDVPAPADHDPEKMLAVPHHKIVCVGALLFDNYEVKTIGILSDGKEERIMIGDFVRFVSRTEPVLVTFNGRGFDLPVIAMRCLKYGIPFPYYYNSRDVRYRYTADGHLDLMDFLSDFGGTKSGKLDAVAKLCGMPGKVGTSGADVAAMVAAGRLNEVKIYCLCDVVQTSALFLRTQLLRGVIDKERYLASVGGLVKLIKGDARLAPVATTMNEERLLLQ
jgi:predicted PolB exonuclease-like 3'-5' exonuclease